MAYISKDSSGPDASNTFTRRRLGSFGPLGSLLGFQGPGKSHEKLATGALSSFLNCKMVGFNENIMEDHL
jgi:hypothetical protein